MTVRLLGPSGEAYRCADLLLRVHAFARRKNDFSLGPYPTDADGVACITKADLEAGVAATIDSGIMDYYRIEDCHPAVQISLATADDILRAHSSRSTSWTSLLSGERRRWHSIGELIALYSRALVATRSLAGLRPLDITAEWTDPSAKHSYDLRFLQSNVA